MVVTIHTLAFLLLSTRVGLCFVAARFNSNYDTSRYKMETLVISSKVSLISSPVEVANYMNVMMSSKDWQNIKKVLIKCLINDAPTIS